MRDPDGIGFVGERERGCFGSELLGGCFVPCRRNRNQVRMVVGSHECGRRPRALARALPGGNLQLAIRVLIGRMPEERRRPALGRFAEPVDRIARNFKQRKRFRLRTVLIPLETPRIGLICHVSPQLLPALQVPCPGTLGSDCIAEFLPGDPVRIVNNKRRDRLHPLGW
jgi:hypothetical protein